MKLRQLFEAPQRHVTVGVCYGRWNPPHKGHRAAWETAAQFGDFYVGTNQNTSGADDPLPYDVKLKAMAAIWPEVAGHVIPETNLFTLVTKIFGKYGEGVDLKVATDEAWLVNSLLKYNGIEAAHGYYKFNSITHVPTPRLSSATALRAAVRAGDREAFAEAAGVPADTPIHIGKKSVPFFDLVEHYLSQYPEKAKKAKKEVAEIFSNDKETGTTHKGGAVTKTAHGIKHTKTDYDDGHGERGRKSTGRESRYKQTPILDKDYDVAECKEDKGITAIVNSMLKGVPSSVAEGIRSAVARSTDKLAALKNGLEKHQAAMEDGILAEDGTDQYGNIYQLDRIMLEAGMKKMNKKHSAAIRNAITFPDQNSSSGSAYLNYRIGVAMAGAPNFDTPADNFIGGDPLFAPYTKEELDKVNFAAKQVGSKGKQVWSDSGSNEVADTNVTSTVSKPKRNQYGV